MGDLEVDYDLLHESEKKLNDLHQFFKEIAHHRDDKSHIWGASSIMSAMDNFVNNWDNYRRQFLKDVQATGEKVATARKAFKKADDPKGKHH